MSSLIAGYAPGSQPGAKKSPAQKGELTGIGSTGGSQYQLSVIGMAGCWWLGWRLAPTDPTGLGECSPAMTQVFFFTGLCIRVVLPTRPKQAVSGTVWNSRIS